MARFRWFCCCLPGCAALVVVPLAFLGVALKLGGERPPDLVPAPTYTPAQVKRAEAHVNAVKRQAERLRRSAEKGKRAPFKFVLSEDDLNAYLNGDPDVRERMKIENVRDVHVTLGQGTVGFQGRATVTGRPVWIRAEGPLRAGSQGKIFFEPTQVEFGRLKWQVPESMKARIREQVQTEASRAVFRVPGDIRHLQVADGKLVIQGVADPASLKRSSPGEGVPIGKGAGPAP